MEKTNKGFTLIEILVATSILVVVFTIGFVIFSMITNSYYQAKANTRTSQAGRYVMEALSREVRLANSFSVDVLDNGILDVTDQNGLKKEYSVDSYVLSVKNFDTGGNLLGENPLTDSDQVQVTDFKISHHYTEFLEANQRQQPFATISFTLKYVGEKSEKFSSAQTFQTTVSSQKYNEPETETE